MKTLYVPFPLLSVDDDLDLWTGRFGRKKYNPKKADGTGLASWKIVDVKRICVHIFWEDEMHPSRIASNENNNQNGTIFQKSAEMWMKLCEEKIPQGSYTFVIDAGTLKCLQNAEYLQQHNRKFIMSCAMNRPTYLWQVLHAEKIQLNNWKCVSNDKMLALSYYARNTPKKKMVNFLFNIQQHLDEGEDKLVQVKNKITGNYELQLVKFPKIVRLYNHTHNYIDALKHVISRSKNVLRARKSWRVKLNSMLYILLANAYHYWKILRNFGRQKSCFSDFILQVVTGIATQKSGNEMQSPKGCIILHQLSTTKKRRRCKICHKLSSHFCQQCDNQPFIHPHPCSIKFHNANKHLIL